MPNETTKKMTIREIRDYAIRINNPSEDIEVRQRALISLFVELSDRCGEMFAVVLAGIKRREAVAVQHTEQIAELASALRAMGASLQIGADSPATAPAEAVADATDPSAPLNVEALAAAELAALPVSMRQGAPQAGNGAPTSTPSPTASKMVKKPKASKPTAPAEVVVAPPPTDPAAIAMGMNGADGVPAVPVVSSAIKA